MVGFINTLKPEDRKILLNVKEQFGDLSQSDLIRYTYRQYPYYATKSVIAKELLNSTDLDAIEQQKRHYPEKQLFTIGYEGISLETYINKLIINDVNVLCDVRKNAYSQKCNQKLEIHQNRKPPCSEIGNNSAAKTVTTVQRKR